MYRHSRSAPYSTKERILLARLVKQHTIIEDKRTDSETLREKQKAWDAIAQKYNSQSDVDTPRTWEQLRKCWNNLKQRKRRETTALRRSMLGGNSTKKPMLDPVLQAVERAAPSLKDDIVCPWDSTTLFEKSQAVATNVLEEGADEVFIRHPIVGDCEESSATKLFSSMPDKQLSNICFDIDVKPEPTWTESNSIEVLPEEQGQSSSSFPNNTSTANGTDFISETKYTITPCSTTIASTYEMHEQKRQGTGVEVANEKVARIKRITDGTCQQQELHEMKMEIAEVELRMAIEARKHQEKKNQMELRRAELFLQAAEDEARLASLKLKEFERKIVSGDHE